LTARSVSRKLREAYLKFYLRPSYLLRRRNLLKSVLTSIYQSYIRPLLFHSDPEAGTGTWLRDDRMIAPLDGLCRRTFGMGLGRWGYCHSMKMCTPI